MHASNVSVIYKISEKILTNHLITLNCFVPIVKNEKSLYLQSHVYRSVNAQSRATFPYLYYYRRAVLKKLLSKFEGFLPVLSQFDRDHGVDFYAPTCCQSATVGPLFAFYCPLFFTRIVLIMSHFARDAMFTLRD